MGIRNLDDKLDLIDDLIKLALNARSGTNKQLAIGKVSSEYKKLRFMIDGLMSFVEHRWEVKLFTTDGTPVVIKIRAEHLEEAREVSIDLCDAFPEVIRYELYCDGIIITEEN